MGLDGSHAEGRGFGTGRRGECAGMTDADDLETDVEREDPSGGPAGEQVYTDEADDGDESSA